MALMAARPAVGLTAAVTANCSCVPAASSASSSFGASTASRQWRSKPALLKGGPAVRTSLLAAVALGSLHAGQTLSSRSSHSRRWAPKRRCMRSPEAGALVGRSTRRHWSTGISCQLVSVATAQAAEASATEGRKSPESADGDVTSAIVSRLSSLPLQDVEFPIWDADVAQSDVKSLVAAAGNDGSQLGDAARDWPGLWRVVYAPHIRTGGGALQTRFDVYYDIADDGKTFRSFVRFASPFGAGWLNAAGFITSLAGTGMEVAGVGKRPATEVVFKDYWVDLDEALPRSSAKDELLSQLGAPFFFQDLSRFPTLVFERQAGLVVFRFPPLGVEIAARRVGPSGTEPRKLAMA